jgi:Trp operon repressor
VEKQTPEELEQELENDIAKLLRQCLVKRKINTNSGGSITQIDFGTNNRRI